MTELDEAREAQAARRLEALVEFIDATLRAHTEHFERWMEAHGHERIDAKLSPAPVGEDGPTMQYFYRASGCPANGPYESGCICWHDQGTGPFSDARPGRLTLMLTWREKPAPTPPAEGSDGGNATASWDNSLAEANGKIAGLEARLAEAATEIADLTHDLTRAFDEKAAAERDLAEARKRVEALEHARDAWKKTAKSMADAILSPASEGKTDA